ncbi:MAG: cyclic nucleotide-binding domain-containing protein, partial [Variovorax sp.]
MSPDPALRRVFEAHFPGVALPSDIAAGIARRRLADGRSLFMQGQKTTAFYAVAAGEIETRFSAANGTVSVIENVGPPRLFGLAAFAAGRPSEYEAIARGASEVLVFGREAYTRLMDEVPGFARALLAEFACRRSGARTRPA